jgi:hypothetical protein
MAVNFNMLKQAGPANFYEGLVQGQEQQRVNALEQQKMAQEQEFNALRLQQTRGAISQQQRQEKAQAVAQKTGMFRERLLRASDPNTVRELVKMQYADPDLGPILSQTGTLEQALAEVSDDPAQFERYRQQEAMGMAEWMKSQMPKVTPTGDVYDPAKREFIRKPQPERAPAAPGAPVAVMGPDGKPRYVNREDAIGMTPFTPAAVKFMGGGGGGASAAAPAKPLTEPQLIKLRTDVSKDYKAATTTLSQMEDLLDSIEKVKTAPGLSAATGFTGKYLPSFPEGKAAQAETRLANLRGKVTALGKATAAMSGAIGSIANQEWKILSDQIAALDEVKGKGPLLEQIALVEQQARGAIERVRDTYEKTRAEDFERFPQFRDLPAPRGKKDSGGGNIDALLDKYK